jgi:hypothetical protein
MPPPFALENFKFWPCEDICHGRPNSSTRHALWEMTALKSECLQKFSHAQNSLLIR